MASLLFSDSRGGNWDFSTYQAEPLESTRLFFNPFSLFNRETPQNDGRLDEDQKFFLFDGHAHTLASDGQMSVPQLLEWATKCGRYDAIAITDHNTFEGGISGREFVRNRNLSVVVFAGMEYSSCAAHMNILIPPSISDVDLRAFEKQESIAPSGALTIPKPSVNELMAFVERIHAQLPGSLVILNHFSWSTKYERQGSMEKTLPYHPTLDQFISSIKVDGFEAINGHTLEASLLSSPLINSSFLLVSGSDVHYPISPTCWTALIPDPIDAESERETMMWNALLRSKEHPLLALRPEGAAPIPSQVLSAISFFKIFLYPLSAISSIFVSTFISVDSGMYSFIDGERCHQCKVSVNWISIPMFILVILLFSVLAFVLNRLITKKIRTSNAKVEKRQDINFA